MTQPDPTNEPRKIVTTQARKELHSPNVQMGSAAWHAVHALIVAIDASNPPTPAEAREPTGNDPKMYTYEQMVEFAKKNPPPQSWFDENHEALKSTTRSDPVLITRIAYPESSPGVGAGAVKEKCRLCGGTGKSGNMYCSRCIGFGTEPSPSSPAATEGGRFTDGQIEELIEANAFNWKHAGRSAEFIKGVARAVEDAARKDERDKLEGIEIIGALTEAFDAPISTPPADAELRERIANTVVNAYCGLKIEWRQVQHKEIWLSAADALLPLISSLRAADQARIDKLEKFKTTVHDALDQMGIPHDDSTNQKSKEGCRVGARLDLVAARIRELEQQVAGKSGKQTAE